MKSILAIAHKSLLKAFHDKMFLGITLLFITLLPSLPMILRGDGSAQGQLQLYISYSLNFIIFFLSLLTIFQSCNSLYEELEKKQLYILATKPIPRWKIIVGHWLGTTLLISMVLIVATSINFSSIQWIFSRYKNSLTTAERNRISQELFTARRSVPPDQPSMEQLISQKVAEYQKNHPDEKTDPEQLAGKFKQEIFFKLYCAAPKNEKTWVFKNLHKIHADTLTLRFKVFCSNIPASGKISSQWIFGTTDSTVNRQNIKTIPESFYDITVPVSAVSQDGSLTVTFINSDKVTVIFPEDKGPEVLYYSTSFFINYCMGILLIFVQISFLAATGVMFSSFLSFPVACLMTLFVYGIGANATSIIQTLSQTVEIVHEHHHGESLEEVQEQLSVTAILARKILSVVITVFPHLDIINPAGALTNGRLIEYKVVYQGLFFICLLQGSIVLGTGSLIFNRREIAKVTI